MEVKKYMDNKNNQKSESFILASLLAIVGGFLDAYTFCCRDKVWIVNTFLDNFYENILNSTGVL